MAGSGRRSTYLGLVLPEFIVLGLPVLVDLLLRLGAGVLDSFRAV
jgi:hypothetical protein